MKKFRVCFIILILIFASACKVDNEATHEHNEESKNNVLASDNEHDEIYYMARYISQLSEDNTFLAAFLLQTRMLDEVIMINVVGQERISPETKLECATIIFEKNPSTRQEAFKKALAYLANADWRIEQTISPSLHY